MTKARTRTALLDRMLRYFISGGTAYLVELVVLVVLVAILQLDSVAAVAISFWVGLVMSFILQKMFAFQNYDHSSRRLFHQSLLYGGLILFNYAFTLMFVAVFAPLLTVFVARTAAIAVTTLWNFVIYGKVIFPPAKTEKARAPKA